MFDIQKFADTVTSSTNLKIEWGFEDGDTRTFNLPNPIDEISSSDVAALNTWVATNQPIVGDKSGSSSTGINSAIKVESTKTKLDISGE